MSKQILIIFTLFTVVCQPVHGQEKLLDSITAGILSRLEVIDTSTMIIMRPKLITWRYHHAEGLVVHHKTGAGETYDYIGPWKFYYRSGVLKISIFINLERSKQGIKKEYYKNGNKKNEIDYGRNQNNECCNHLLKWFTKEGVIDYEGQIIDGKRDGKWYFYENGELHHFVDYSNAPEKIVPCKKKES